MIEKVTFAASTKGKEAEIHQSFSIAELNLEEGLSEEAIEEKIQELFKRWVLDSISFSITVDRSKDE
ncbi:hypothetical protein JMA_02590 [Jeotgalibacillus malaysiensis]|uniref:Uncharacterized protein n=1 Tax=Jeotgalibacillus malaysiensis TaxID=1508404 RepID=A0A0B5AHM3_9BACL|nr:hypothetical protein [Jeotgalibacillus malaysiensis]AJD89576.1 hypothetical protein JMA_02590 [Jeotgalibacillus malaysiensis]